MLALLRTLVSVAMLIALLWLASVMVRLPNIIPSRQWGVENVSRCVMFLAEADLRRAASAWHHLVRKASVEISPWWRDMKHGLGIQSKDMGSLQQRATDAAGSLGRRYQELDQYSHP